MLTFNNSDEQETYNIFCSNIYPAIKVTPKQTIFQNFKTQKYCTKKKIIRSVEYIQRFELKEWIYKKKTKTIRASSPLKDILFE